MKRCREGQIIACIRSNEMVARLQREAMENKWSNATLKEKTMSQSSCCTSIDHKNLPRSTQFVEDLKFPQPTGQ